jgi:cyclomaltodextrinase / maltogenic alpha-amylase / neopullulanase
MRWISVLSFLLCAGVGIMSAAPKTQTRISLDGTWLFTADSTRTGVEQRLYRPELDRAAWQKVTTPDFWEAYPGLARYDGWGWFFRTFTLDAPVPPLSIHFAGVDDDAEVWVNGKPVGDHAGYSDPFVLDLSSAVKPGENTIAVLVKDYSGGGGIYRPVTVIETAAVAALLKGPFADIPARMSAPWVRDAVIYSVYLRSFSPEGTFAGLEKRVPELKALGITTLWLMPIHPVGLKNRKGTLGSPYAVQDYYGINPEFGTMDDFKHLLATVHSQGMKLIIDMVANHTSWDSKLMMEHPEWFTRSEKGEIIPPNADWHDVADLDYSNAGLRAYMKEMLVWWVRDIGIDGYRCDVADLVPTDFWEDVREALDQVKPVMMLAEGSLPEQHRKAFDLTYAWNVYDALEPVFSGKRPLAVMDQVLRTEELLFPRGSLRLRFVTNHDKNAWDAPAMKKFGPGGLRVATVLVNTLPGVPLLYNGEEVANDRPLDLFEKVGIDWSRPREMGEMNRMLYALRRSNPAVILGTFERVKGTGERDVYAYIRSFGKSRVFVVLNFSKEPRSVKLQMPDLSGVAAGDTCRFHELFLDREWDVPSRGGEVKLSLEPHGYRVFTIGGSAY